MVSRSAADGTDYQTSEALPGSEDRQADLQIWAAALDRPAARQARRLGQTDLQSCCCGAWPARRPGQPGWPCWPAGSAGPMTLGRTYSQSCCRGGHVDKEEVKRSGVMAELKK